MCIRDRFKDAVKYVAPVVLIVLVVMLLGYLFPPIITFVPNLLMGA